MNTSLALLEEKHRRAHLFGKYLESHPAQGPLEVELQKSLCLYRIALHNCIEAQKGNSEPGA